MLTEKNCFLVVSATIQMRLGIDGLVLISWNLLCICYMILHKALNLSLSLGSCDW